MPTTPPSSPPPFPDRASPGFATTMDKIRQAVRLLDEAAAYFGGLRHEAYALLTAAAYAGTVLTEYEEDTTS